MKVDDDEDDNKGKIRFSVAGEVKLKQSVDGALGGDVDQDEGEANEEVEF